MTERTAPTCLHCQQPVPIKKSRDYDKRWCNQTCYGIWRRMEPKTCPTCAQTFRAKLSEVRFCSKACANRSRASTYLKICERCGDEFLLRNRAYERRGHGRFCSASCAQRRYSVDESFFNHVDSSQKAYWLGFLFADGYQDGQELVVNLARRDASHLYALKETLRSEHPVRISGRKAQLRISSQRLCGALSALGCVQAKSLILEPPIGVPSEHMWAFLAGYFDGDGCISISRGRYARVSMHCAGPSFRSWLLAMLNAAGGMGPTNPRSQQGRNICISNRAGIERFETLIYAVTTDFALARKRQKFEAFRRIEPRVLRANRVQTDQHWAHQEMRVNKVVSL